MSAQTAHDTAWDEVISDLSQPHGVAYFATANEAIKAHVVVHRMRLRILLMINGRWPLLLSTVECHPDALPAWGRRLWSVRCYRPKGTQIKLYQLAADWGNPRLMVKHLLKHNPGIRVIDRSSYVDACFVRAEAAADRALAAVKSDLAVAE